MPNHTLRISDGSNRITATIIERKRTSPGEIRIVFESSDFLPMGSYPAEWRHGDESAHGTVAVLWVRTDELATRGYVYTGFFRKR